MPSTASWQFSLHSFSDAATAGRSMLRTSRTHKAAAATFEKAAEPAAEAMTTDTVVVEDVRSTQCKERDIIYS
jgi:hypothetical protein